MSKKVLLLSIIIAAFLLSISSSLLRAPAIGYLSNLTYQSAVPGPSGITYIFYTYSGNLYVQAYDSSGNPLWGKLGKLVSSKGQVEMKSHAVPDGHGGAIVVWYVRLGWGRGYFYCRLFAQRIDQNGNILWGSDGKLLSELNISCFLIPKSVSLAPDDEGGVYAVFDLFLDRWDNPVPDNKIYIQRLNSEGERMFGTEGILVAPGDMVQFQEGWHAAAGDGEGGVITAWIDTRYGNPAVLAQRFNKQGEALWPSPGIIACSAIPGVRYFPHVIADGSGGAILAWRDRRPENGDEFALYAQKISKSGDVLWKEDGRFVGISTTAIQWWGYVHISPRRFDLIRDGSGGAIFSWYGKEGIFIQKLDGNGDRQWDLDGKLVTPHWTRGSLWQLMAGMSEGKFIITWLDSNGVYARIFDKDGNFLSGDRNIIVSQGLGFYGDVFWMFDINGFGASIPVYDGTGTMIFFEAGTKYWIKELYGVKVNEDGTVGVR